MKLKLVCNGFTMDTNVNVKKDNITSYRYIKSSYKKTGVDIESIILNQMNFERGVCPFCERKSAVTIKTYLNENILVVDSVDHHKIEGVNNYHCKSGRLKCKGSLLNPNSAEYVMTACKITKEEALNIIHKRNKSPFYKENHISESAYKQSQARDLRWYIKRYGKELGTINYQKRTLKLKEHCTHKYQVFKYGKEFADFISKKKATTVSNMIERYGEELGVIRYKKWLNDTRLNLDTFIRKYGAIEGEARYNAFCDKRAYRNTLQYFIDKLGYEEGIVAYKVWTEKITWTKEKHIQKYGEDSWVNKILSTKRKSYSTESVIFFNKLLKALEDIKFDKIIHGEDEYYQYDYINKKIYFYDLFLSIGNKKIIIEYDTPFCHPSSLYMTKDDYDKWVFPFSPITPHEKEQYDEQKKLLAEKNGHLVLTAYIINDNHEDMLKELINKIKKYVN